MGQTDMLFPEKTPDYQPLLKKTGTIKSFKEFEDTVKELRFCQNKMKTAKENRNHAQQLAAEPFQKEIDLLEKEIEVKRAAVESYYLENEESLVDKMKLLPDVEFEEIHKIKIKFKKESTQNAKA